MRATPTAGTLRNREMFLCNNSVEWAIDCNSILNVSALLKKLLGAITTGNFSALSSFQIQQCNMVEMKKEGFVTGAEVT